MMGASDRGDRFNVGGIHNVCEYHRLTNLQMVLKGFDSIKGKIIDATGGITLINREGEEAAVGGMMHL